MEYTKHQYIGGKWVAGKGTKRQIINPANESLIVEVQEASREQTEEAVKAARQAFETSSWPAEVQRRVNSLHQLADLLEIKAEQFAAAETTNTGKPIRESRLDIHDTVTCLRYYADLASSRKPWEKEMHDGTTSKVMEEPIGVCALIVPWNFPLLLGIWKIAPALIAGNTVVFKPSEITPVSALMLTELIDQCDFPAGVFNLVLGTGQPVGETLVSHPDVDKVSFTGGSETGRKVNEQCARSFKRVSLELGGKSPLIVLEDADIEAAVEWSVFGAFFNQGQVCVASSRVLVHQSIYHRFLDRLLIKLQQVKLGDPRDEETEMGPVISAVHQAKIEKYIELGKEEGAVLLHGGERQGETGYYLTPAVFTEVSQHMRILQEEIFGPVVTIQAFTSDNEAIELANGTVYGLAAGVLSQDTERAERIASRLKAGTIWINSYHTPYVEAPWGGYKQSGIGRELGPQGLSGFTEVKHVNVSNELQPVGWYR
ncbi:aldehyde dehydrogenase family protein [Fictibacillus terranigra]|uniref:aldehyde dehydrogenase (NAD(+)) n=1 Tax=Fictibacillus terranigra TaxID=3058424 RepID=A0ABT8EC56_9BACL|nr:aldehyde dehydrogenase family protein [Fictibacillus sp. CENA-BCM004]MDN4075470.1 aldehyde dehydrogenase family protein [Fictibacillus sp. CENA-BCM004]